MTMQEPFTITHKESGVIDRLTDSRAEALAVAEVLTLYRYGTRTVTDNRTGEVIATFSEGKEI